MKNTEARLRHIWRTRTRYAQTQQFQVQDIDSTISANSLKKDGTLHSDVFTKQSLKIKMQGLFEVCQVLFFVFEHCLLNQIHCFLQRNKWHKKQFAGRMTLVRLKV